MSQWVKNPLPIQETWVQSQGGEDPLEKEMATHSIILFFFLNFLPASGCKPAWDLRGARGRWASLYSLRLSDRPSPSASSKRASCLLRAAPWVD